MNTNYYIYKTKFKKINVLELFNIIIRSLKVIAFAELI